jgi:hypothetical protein
MWLEVSWTCHHLKTKFWTPNASSAGRPAPKEDSIRGMRTEQFRQSLLHNRKG